MCNACGSCIKTCPVGALRLEEGSVVWDESVCVNCDTCIRVCPNLSSPKIHWMSVADIMQILQKKRAFLRGITVSGGECMNHANFLTELFREVKTLGLTCLIDSNGYYDFEKYPELMALCDGVMLDVKAVNSEFHQQLTGCANTMVLKNLQYLLDSGKLEEVRTVILPNQDVNNEETVRYISSLLGNRSRYKLIRYRKYGVRPAGLEVLSAQNTSEEYIAKYQALCKENGNHTSVII